METYPTTKTGGKMKLGVREKILDVMADKENDGKTQKQLAALVGITDKTLRNYLTSELWQEIKRRRLYVMFSNLDAVDEVMFTKALRGDIQAAKMIYARWAEKQAQKKLSKNPPLPETMSALDKEIEEIREQIRSLEDVERKGKELATKKTKTAPTKTNG